RFHDLSPSMSHDALVFRRGANPAVWACWNPDEETYELAFVDPGFTHLRDRRRAAATNVFLDLLYEYLDRSPVDKSPTAHVAIHATDESGTRMNGTRSKRTTVGSRSTILPRARLSERCAASWLRFAPILVSARSIRASRAATRVPAAA